MRIPLIIGLSVAFLAGTGVALGDVSGSPGSPPAGPPAVFGPFRINDLDDTAEQQTINLGFVPQQGFYVLKEDPSKPDSDNTNWSDVLDFTSHSAQMQAIFISDKVDGLGITNADLAGLGLSVAQIVAGPTVFDPAGEMLSGNTYTAANNPETQASYIVFSDPSGPEMPEPSSLMLVCAGAAIGLLSRGRSVRKRATQSDAAC